MKSNPEFRHAAIPIERFRRFGLDPPIVVKADMGRLLTFLAVPLGCLALIVFAFLLVEAESQLEGLAAITGLIFIGIGGLVLIAYLMARTGRDALILSEEGIQLGFYGLEIGWSDIGPAWIYSIGTEEGQRSGALFLVRRWSSHKVQLPWDKRLLLSFVSRGAKSHGPANDIGERMDALRVAVAADDDSVAIPLPNQVRQGLSNEEAVEIINTVVLQRNRVTSE